MNVDTVLGISAVIALFIFGPPLIEWNNRKVKEWGKKMESKIEQKRKDLHGR